MSKNNAYLVIGLGSTGLSCVRYLVSKNIPVIVADSRENPPKLAELKKDFPNIEIHLGKFSQNIFDQANMIIVSPGVSLSEPCIQHCMQKNIPVIGDVELFACEARAPIIAITGSNGKSTLTTLMGDLINQAGKKAIVCGNIGLPALDALSQPIPDYYVVELSSFQLDATHSLKAKVAVVINVSPDHMDRYPTLQDYLTSKQHIYHHCENAIVNADELEIWKNLTFQKQPIEFTLQIPNQNQWGVRAGFLSYGAKNLIAISELPLQQRHNNQNFLAALAIGTCLKLPMESMLKTLQRFTGLEHRCQLVKKINGVSWYNDSKATNVGAAIAAIESMAQSLQGKLILLAGGDSKGVSLLPLQAPVKKYVSHVILFGKDADLLEKTLQDCTHIARVKTLREGVLHAKKIAQSGDVVLLAPACSSLDQYENYVARGRDFINAVNDVLQQ